VDTSLGINLKEDHEKSGSTVFSEDYSSVHMTFVDATRSAIYGRNPEPVQTTPAPVTGGTGG